MLRVMIVEDNSLVAGMLKDMLEASDSSFGVVGFADDFDSAIELAAVSKPDIALIDIELASHSTGYAVAAALREAGVGCIFITGNAPPFPIPEFAIGCITKPCTIDALSIALATAAPLPRHSAPLPPQPRRDGFELY